MYEMHDWIVIGGGAAGVFGAIAAAPAKVLLLEKSAVLLSKVRISGGGRCNVTHHCFDPKLLVLNYPRGGKELLGPFHRFQPRDTMEWFESRGVALKTEADGRVFPVSNDSETIIRALLAEAERVGVEIRLRQRVQSIAKEGDHFLLTLREGEPLRCRKLLLATGSSPEGYAFAKQLGHTIQEPVPSLFTFNVPTSPLKELSGIAVNPVELKVGKLVQRGPLLITHFGFSGPAVLKLSAWGARDFFAQNYRTELLINWLPDFSEQQLFELFCEQGIAQPMLPKNLWKFFCGAQRSHKELRALAHRLHRDPYQIDGKTTNKEEFVTCGGVTLKEVDFQTMQSKLCPGLFFAGEILNIDGVTGGFNFQNGWTTSFIAGR